MEWISVKDRLPEVNSVVMTVDEYGYMNVCGISNKEFYPAIDGHHPNWMPEVITHWQDLPEPPKT